AVTSEPQGAQVARTDAKGATTDVGVTPVVDAVTIDLEEKVETPKTGALWIGTVLEIVGGFAMEIGGTIASGVDNPGRTVLLGFTGSMILTSGIVDGIVALVHGAKNEKI